MVHAPPVEIKTAARYPKNTPEDEVVVGDESRWRRTEQRRRPSRPTTGHPHRRPTVLGGAPYDRQQHPPAVQREPGKAFRIARISESKARYPISCEATPYVESAIARKRPAMTSVLAGPTNATRNSPSGPRALARVSVAPPQKTNVTPAPAGPSSSHHGVAVSWIKMLPKNRRRGDRGKDDRLAGADHGRAEPGKVRVHAPHVERDDPHPRRADVQPDPAHRGDLPTLPGRSPPRVTPQVAGIDCAVG